MKWSMRHTGVVLIVIVFAFLLLAVTYKPKKPVYGFTYSATYAEYLGMDPVQSFEQILRDIPFRFVRLPVYWDRYEPLNGIYHDEELKQLLDIADREQVHVILAIGQKVPRWPECYIPDWTTSLSEEGYRTEFLSFKERTLNMYGKHPAVKRWQVENESYFPFGDCKAIDPKLIRAQADLVRKYAPRVAVQTTVSGEQGVGFNKTPFADIVGFSLYRSVAVPLIGKYTFPHTPFFYRAQAALVTFSGKRSVISELQAEPWGLHEFDLSKPSQVQAAYQAFTVQDLENQLLFARQTGISEIGLWGVEWWLALAKRDESRLWEAGKRLFE